MNAKYFILALLSGVVGLVIVCASTFAVTTVTIKNRTTKDINLTAWGGWKASMDCLYTE